MAHLTCQSGPMPSESEQRVAPLGWPTLGTSHRFRPPDDTPPLA